MTFPSISADDIHYACLIDGLDDALASLMVIAGIDDGGVAGVVFSFPDAEGTWERADYDARATMLRDWLATEALYS